MKSYILHISDSRRTDCEMQVDVDELTTLARGIQAALEDFEKEHGAEVEFPLFLDLHPVEEFADRAWMHSPG